MNKDSILFQLYSQQSAWTEGKKQAEMELLKMTVGVKLLTDVIGQIKSTIDDTPTYDRADIVKCIQQFCSENSKMANGCKCCPFQIPQKERAKTLANAEDNLVMCMAPIIEKNIKRIESECAQENDTAPVPGGGAARAFSERQA